ncbi:MAG: alpha/beta hydrolase fold domain-containing protein [Anaerolineae bacterium]|nr:alpha/beta hydrolase fold domain-containing protein [Anaerolineae bacterium]
MKRSFISILFTLIFFSACLPQASPNPTPAPTKTNKPSPTASPSSTPTLRPSPTSTRTPTAIPTNTPIPTSTATQTFDSDNLGEIETDAVYCTIDGVSLKMDIYYPTYGDQPWPVVVYVHGGRWTGGDKATGSGLRYVEALLDEQIMVVSVNYRLAPEYVFPAPLEDIKCAVRHLRANAGYYNLNPLKIGTFGTSAGGHLTSMLGLVSHGAGYDDAGGYQDTYSRVQAVASLFAPSDFSFSCKDDLVSYIFGASSCKDTGTLLLASPLSYVGSNAPPFLLIHGEKDRIVPIKHSRVLYRALTDAGAPYVTLVEVENGGHGFQAVGGKLNPTKSQISKLLIDFFVQYLK